MLQCNFSTMCFYQLPAHALLLPQRCAQYTAGASNGPIRCHALDAKSNRHMQHITNYQKCVPIVDDSEATCGWCSWSARAVAPALAWRDLFAAAGKHSEADDDEDLAGLEITNEIALSHLSSDRVSLLEWSSFKLAMSMF